MTGLLQILRGSWDKLILIVIMLGVAGVSWALVLGFTEPPDVGVQGVADYAVAEPYDDAEYQELVARIETPLQLAIDQPQRTFIPGEYVTCINANCQRPIPYDALRCPHCGQPQPEPESREGDRDRDGIPNEIEAQNGLDPYNPLDAAGDNDGDGYTNLEEYKFKTGMNDSNSQPPRAAKLRWVTILRYPFQLRFKGVSLVGEGVQKFQINLGDLNRTFFGKVGDVVEGYRIMNYEERITESATGEKIDESVLTVQNVEDPDEVYPLVKWKVMQKEEYTARLYLTIPPYRQYQKMKINDELMIGTDKYRIVDITGSSLTIRDLQTDEEFEVPRWRPPAAYPGQGGAGEGGAMAPTGRRMR